MNIFIHIYVCFWIYTYSLLHTRTHTHVSSWAEASPVRMTSWCMHSLLCTRYVSSSWHSCIIISDSWILRDSHARDTTPWCMNSLLSARLVSSSLLVWDECIIAASCTLLGWSSWLVFLIRVSYVWTLCYARGMSGVRDSCLTDA